MAAGLPDACGVVTGTPANMLDVTGHRHTTVRPDEDACEYTVSHGRLTVTVRAERAIFGSSAAAASDRVTTLSNTMDGALWRVPDVGDEAWVNSTSRNASVRANHATFNLVARRANVVLVMTFSGGVDAGTGYGAVVSAAKVALGGLDVG